jgi:peptidoglycan/xylan/chitin deacetylase (PgdA/CDA1 family)
MLSKILVTVDTEVGDGAAHVHDAFDKLVVGKCNGDDWGYSRIAGILEDCEVVGDFFVSAFESKIFQEERYARVCQNLCKRGQNVQLHTHPGYWMDEKRVRMSEYSLVDQIDLIANGTRLMRGWIGRKPRAHRAGSYGVNGDTLRALATNGILVDSSYYEGRSICRCFVNKANQPMWYCGVLEVPITVAVSPRKLCGFPFPLLSKYRKIDVNGMSCQEMCEAIDRLREKVPFIVVFLHSFSFMKFHRPDYSTEGVRHELVDSFKQLLDYLKREQYDFSNFDQIHEQVACKGQGVQT